MTTDRFSFEFNTNADLKIFAEMHQVQSEYTMSDGCVSYGVSYEDDIIRIHGHGYDDIAWPNLVLIRENEYKFEFDNNLSIIDICDLDGNSIYEDDHPSWREPRVITPTSETPDELKYVAWFGDRSVHGLIHVRDSNKITGRVMGYGYLAEATVRLNEATDVKSYDNGIFAQYVLEGSSPVVGSRIKSFYGVDSSINDDCSFLHETPIGSLVLNCFTTLFSRVLDGMEDKNVHLANKMITKYFGLSNSYNILSDDPLKKYMLGTGEYSDLARLFIFSLLIEYFTKTVGTAKSDAVMNGMASRILSQSEEFDLYETAWIVHELGVQPAFAEILSLVIVKIFEFGKLGIKESSLEYAYAIIRLVREISFDGEILVSELFVRYEDNFKTALSRVLLPSLPQKLVLRAIDGCTLAPLGHVGVYKIHSGLLRYSFDGVSKLSYERFSELIGKVVRFGVTEDSFCYEIVDGLYYDDGSFAEIEYELLEVYESGPLCCEAEVRDRPSVTLEYEERETPEASVLSMKLIEGGSSGVMLSTSVTNKSVPIEDLGNNQYRMYLDKVLTDGLVDGSSPAYVGMLREFATNLDYRGIRLGYNSGETVRDVTAVRYDYITLRVVTTWMESDGVLNLVADRPHGLSEGDLVSIRSSSRSGLINGSFKVLASTEVTASLEYDIPENMNIEDMTGITAVFESLYGTKVYCDVTDFDVGDMVVFDYASEGGKVYEIYDLDSDEVGSYMVFPGFTSRYITKVARSHSQVAEGDRVEFNHEAHLNYYNIAGLDATLESLWLTYQPDLYPTGRTGNTLSFVEFFHKDMNIYS